MCTGAWKTDQGELTALRVRDGGVVTCGQSPHIRTWELFSDQAGDGYWQVSRELCGGARGRSELRECIAIFRTPIGSA